MGSISTVNPKTTDWHAIDWQVAHVHIRNLRQRIYKARLNGDWKKVRGLQKLMLRSRANLLVSVRRATQINRGKTTPGVDRCQQAIVKNALEPFWEAVFEETSYGFRLSRSVHDAIERIFLATKSGSHRTWIQDTGYGY